MPQIVEQPQSITEVDPARIVKTFKTLLSFAGSAGKGKILVVIDGLDSLSGPPVDTWLPSNVPLNTFLVVSSAEAEPLLAKRGWQTLTVTPPSAGDRQTIAEAHAGLNSKVKQPVEGCPCMCACICEMLCAISTSRHWCIAYGAAVPRRVWTLSKPRRCGMRRMATPGLLPLPSAYPAPRACCRSASRVKRLRVRLWQFYDGLSRKSRQLVSTPAVPTPSPCCPVPVFTAEI